jgi:hypothetical protein
MNGYGYGWMDMDIVERCGDIWILWKDEGMGKEIERNGKCSYGIEMKRQNG